MNLIQMFFSGPLLLPTIFLLSTSLWGVLAAFLSFESHGSGSALDHAGGDVPVGDLPGGTTGVDHSGDIPGGSTHVGEAHGGIFTALLQWLNVRDMPLMFWLSAFAILWWVISVVWWMLVDRLIWDVPGPFWSVILMARNLLCTLPLTKVTTLPLKGWENSTHFDARSLVGKECEISSTEAGPNFGQVKFKTQGAPLLLNVRTDGVFLARGARVWITHYDEKKRIYLVSPIDPPKIEGHPSNSN